MEIEFEYDIQEELRSLLPNHSDKEIEEFCANFFNRD